MIRKIVLKTDSIGAGVVVRREIRRRQNEIGIVLLVFNAKKLFAFARFYHFFSLLKYKPLKRCNTTHTHHRTPLSSFWKPLFLKLKEKCWKTSLINIRPKTEKVTFDCFDYGTGNEMWIRNGSSAVFYVSCLFIYFYYFLS